MTKKNLWKRTTAVALVAILMIPVGIQGANDISVAEAAETNLVVNGDFDADAGAIDVSDWTPGAATVAQETEKMDIMTDGGFNSGSTVFNNLASDKGTIARVQEGSNYVLQMTTNSTNTLTIGKGGLPVVGGTEYTVSFKIKIPDNGDADTTKNARIDAYTFQRGSSGVIGGTEVHSDLILKTENDDWETKSFTFTAVTDAVTCDLRFSMNTYVTSVYIDDVEITSAIFHDKMQDVSLELENADFESGTDGWEKVDGNNLSVANGYVGQSLKFDIAQSAGTWGDAQQGVAVEPNTTYTFTFWTKLVPTNGNITTALRIWDYTDNTQISNTGYVAQTTSNQETEWTQVTYEHTTGSQTNRLMLRLVGHHMNRNGASGTCYFDNLSITTKKPVYGDGIVLNGTDYEMKLSNGNSATYGGISFIAGKWYDYGFEVNKDATLGKAGLKVGDNILTATTGSFQYEENQIIGFATEGTGVAYFDNLVIKEHTEHTGGTATCKTLKECSVCGTAYGDYAGHVAGVTWEKDATQHWNTCTTTGCQEKINADAHADGNADELCDICGYNMHEHQWDTNWTYDEAVGVHYHKCTLNNCTERKDEKSCVFGTATCVKKATCSVCSGTKGDFAEHKLSGYKKSDNADTHYQECDIDGCTFKTEAQACSGGMATCQTKAICATCNATYGSFAEHEEGPEWKKDENNHWHACATEGCDEKYDEAAHVGGTASCTAKAECSVCGQAYGNLAVHVYDKEVVSTKTLKAAATTKTKAVYYKSCVCGALSNADTFEYGNYKSENVATDDTEVKKNEESPKTGDHTSFVWIFVAIVALSVPAVAIAKKKRGV